MSPQPKSVANEIGEERQKIWLKLAETHHVDELSIRRLQNRVIRLLEDQAINKSAVRAMLHHELGYLYAYQRSLDAAIRHLDSAGRLGLPEAPLRLSKGHAFFLNGKIAESGVSLDGIDLGREDRQMLKSLSGSYAASGMFRRAQQCADEYGEAGFGYGNVKRAAAIMVDLGIDDVEVTNRLQTAIDAIMGEIKHPLMAYSVFADENEGILFQFVVDGSIDEIVALDNKIAETLSEKYNSAVDSVLAIGVKPHVPSEENIAYEPYHAGV
jgi:hypothetical protein